MHIGSQNGDPKTWISRVADVCTLKRHVVATPQTGLDMLPQPIEELLRSQALFRVISKRYICILLGRQGHSHDHFRPHSGGADACIKTISRGLFAALQDPLDPTCEGHKADVETGCTVRSTVAIVAVETRMHIVLCPNTDLPSTPHPARPF